MAFSYRIYSLVCIHRILLRYAVREISHRIIHHNCHYFFGRGVSLPEKMIFRKPPLSYSISDILDQKENPLFLAFRWTLA
jgi:hypothetical protein